MNIIWQRPDGGVSVTHITEAAQAAMAWARERMPLVEAKSSLVAEQASLEAELSALSVQINAEIEKMEAARGLDEAVFLGSTARAIGFREQEALKQARCRAIVADLQVVAQVENIRDNLGLNEHGHERILLARGDIPADHVCVGHSVEVPADRTFRNAWNWTGKVDHDMEKCRAIHRDRMRAARAPKLAALDVRQLRGEDVEAEKTALRDVTADPAIDAAKTPEELKLVWPEILS